jgi:hypothetical protein
MRSHSSRTVGLAAATAAFIVVAAACGGSTSTGAPPASAAPSAAASVAPSAAPSTAGLEATETFTAANGRTLKYPAGWTTREDLGIFYLSTSAAASDRLVMSQTLQPGEVFVQFAENSIVGAASDPAVHLTDNLKLLFEGQGLTAEPVTTFTSAGRPAARIDASNDKLDMLAVSVKATAGTFADVIAYMAPGEKATYEPLALSMIDSLTYP